MLDTNILIKVFVCLLVVVKLSLGLVEPKPVNTLSRRAAFGAGLAGIAALGTGNVASAFENKISTQYDDRPKRRGSKVRFISGL